MLKHQEVVLWEGQQGVEAGPGHERWQKGVYILPKE